MTETVIIYRLNIIITLLCAILGRPIWPALSS